MLHEAGGFIAASKQQAATAAAIAACDGLDGVVDGVLRDPRVCDFDANAIRCTGPSNATCLTVGEAKAINMIWGGSRNTKNELMWYGTKMGAEMWCATTCNSFPSDFSPHQSSFPRPLTEIISCDLANPLSFPLRRLRL